jgi:hypothetical protein
MDDDGGDSVSDSDTGIADDAGIDGGLDGGDEDSDSASHSDGDTDIDIEPLTISSIATPPTINGTLDDGEWNLDTPITKLAQGTSGNTAQFGAVWDPQSLYVAIMVEDEDLCVGTETDTYNYDSIEVYLDADDSKGDTYDSRDAQIIIKYVDIDYVQYGINTQLYPSVVARGAAVDGGYVVELSIPWADLGITPQEGVSIGFDVGINDDDPPCTNSGAPTRDAELRWAGTADNYQDTGAFGILVLGE